MKFEDTPMTLTQLKYIVETAKAGSISRAAEKLYISQPSLTAAIRELEHEFGITIFQRTNKGILCLYPALFLRGGSLCGTAQDLRR